MHAGIGIGNGLIAHLEEFIDVEVEQISHEEYQLREDKSTTGGCIKCHRELKDVWNNSPDGGRSLTKKRNRIKRLNVEMKQDMDNVQMAARVNEKAQLTLDTNSLLGNRDEYTKEISELEKRLKEIKTNLDKMTKARRGEEESIYTAVDKIFQKIGANRAHYFGRKFEGIDIRKIMDKADDLFGVNGTIRLKLLDNASNSEVEEKTMKICEELGLAFKLWDGVFSAIHEVDPTDDHCDKTQVMIDKAMKQLRLMNFSITPKMHGMEKHVVSQMRKIRGGIAKLIEHWVEQYHQIGHRYDLSYCRAGTLKKQAAIWLSMEKRARHPIVKLNKKRLVEKYQGHRKKKATAVEREEKRVQVKQERREKAFNEFDIKLTLEEMEAIPKTLEVAEQLDEMDDLSELESRLC